MNDVSENADLNYRRYTLILLKALLGSLTEPLNLFSGS